MGRFSFYTQDGNSRDSYSFLGVKVDTLSASDFLPTGKDNGDVSLKNLVRFEHDPFRRPLSPESMGYPSRLRHGCLSTQVTREI